MAGFDAVVFDLDGTLIDSEALYNEAGVLACARLGMPVSLEFFGSLAGIHDEERVRLISAHVGRPLDRDGFMAEWDAEAYGRMTATGLPLKPGALDLLAHLQASGLPLALATSSRREPARQKLVRGGLARFFQAVITVEDVAAAKPAPDPYLAAAARLNVSPGRAVAFEDSETGAASARAAGLTVVQVPDLHGTDGRHAHLVAASLWDGARRIGLVDG
jgi:HAD superfamily hydrolase (TIGR01509 family)